MTITDELLNVAIDLYINNKKSLWDISKQLNTPYNPLRKTLKTKIKLRKSGETSLVTTKEMENDISLNYKNGLSIRQLAIKYNIDRSAIKRVLRQNNIELRNILQSNKKKDIDIDNIIHLYVIKNYSISKIARKLHLSALTVKRKLVDSKTKLKENCGHKFSEERKIKIRKFNKETEIIIIDKYLNSSLSCCEIANQFDTGWQVISNILKNNNIQIRNSEIQNRKYKIDDTYFDNIHSPSKYFILGMLYTDGSVKNEDGKYRISLELQAEDKHIIDFFKKELKTEQPLFYSKKKNTWGIYITNKKLVLKLCELGCIQNKTKILKFPDWIRSELLPHFLHGAFMGDGSLMNSISIPRSFRIDITGTYDICFNIQKEINILLNTGGSIRKHSESDGIYELSYCGAHQVLKICNFIFKDAPFLMKRKYNIYKKLIEYKRDAIDQTEQEKLETRKSIEISSNLDRKFVELLK